MDRATIERAAQLLRQGGLVAFPTETVYGLGANALDPAAVRRIFEVKGRPATSPLIVHVDSLEMARELASEWPAEAEALAVRHWPGPLTLVVPKTGRIPAIVTAGLPTVGLRMPAHPVALELIAAAGVPIAAPSANRFTGLSPTAAEHVRLSLGDAVDMIVDGGSTPVGIESTVLWLAGRPPKLLRPGMISKEEIEALIGPVEEAGAVEGAHPSPGMHRKHYSPRTRLLLIRSPEEAPAGRGAVMSHCAGAGVLETMPADPRGYAAALYAALHRLDQQGYDWIAVVEPPETPAWAGIRDRLIRAAAGERP
jgi:L-threonylcarbamoyladenylate synthase